MERGNGENWRNGENRSNLIFFNISFPHFTKFPNSPNLLALVRFIVINSL